MSRLVLLASALLILPFSSQAVAQATAEAAMGNSAAGNAAAKTGSALGNALGKAFDKSAEKLGTAMQTPPQQNPAPATTPSGDAVPAAVPSQPASLQATPDAALVQFSVQETGTSCPPPKDWHKADSGTSSDTRLTVCSLHASPAPFPKTKYKPVVDIKF